MTMTDKEWADITKEILYDIDRCVYKSNRVDKLEERLRFYFEKKSEDSKDITQTLGMDVRQCALPLIMSYDDPMFDTKKPVVGDEINKRYKVYAVDRLYRKVMCVPSEDYDRHLSSPTHPFSITLDE